MFSTKSYIGQQFGYHQNEIVCKKGRFAYFSVSSYMFKNQKEVKKPFARFKNQMFDLKSLGDFSVANEQLIRALTG